MSNDINPYAAPDPNSYDLSDGLSDDGRVAFAASLEILACPTAAGVDCRPQI